MLFSCRSLKPLLIERSPNIVRTADFFTPLAAHLGCGMRIASGALAEFISSTVAISCSLQAMSRSCAALNRRCKCAAESSNGQLCKWVRSCSRLSQNRNCARYPRIGLPLGVWLTSRKQWPSPDKRRCGTSERWCVVRLYRSASVTYHA